MNQSNTRCTHVIEPLRLHVHIGQWETTTLSMRTETHTSVEIVQVDTKKLKYNTVGLKHT